MNETFIAEFEKIKEQKFDALPYLNILHNLNGMLTPPIMHAINTAVSQMVEGDIYLEIGTHQGCSLISALTNNDKHAIAVDNFSQFSEMGNFDILYENLKKFNVLDRVKFREMNYIDFFVNGSVQIDRPVGVYFYDGNHSEEDTFLGLNLAYPFLKKNCLIFIDDYSWGSVYNGVKRFLRFHGANVLAEITHMDNDKLWHNGLCIMEKNEDLH